MPDLDCKICFTLLDNEVYLPRILSCGHTYCSKCLQSILESTQSCPRCSKATTRKNVKDFPINIDFLEMISSSTKRVQNRTQLQKIKSELEDLKPVLQSMFNKVKAAEEQLKVLVESIDGSVDEEELTAKIKELGETVKQVTLEINVSDSRLISNVSLRSKDYDSILHLMAKIQNGIQVKGQKFAAVLRIDGVKKFAKMSISENYFFIHAFDTYEDDGDFVTICFQDIIGLLRSDLAKAAHGFLELSYQSGSFNRKAIIKVVDSTSLLAPHFLKLCTGEVGLSLKGLEYSQSYEQIYSELDETYYEDHIIELKYFGWDLEKLCNYSKHFSSESNIFSSVEAKSCFLTCDADGSVKILRNLSKTSMDFENVIGPIVDFKGNFAETFRGATQCKVLDCGIAFAL